MNAKIMDPSNKKDFIEILKMHHGFTESDEGNLVDVTKELIDKVDLFVKATPEQREKDFGEAGKVISNDCVLVTKNHHLIYTTIIPPGTLGRHGDKRVIFTDKLYMGGYDKDGKPNKCDAMFEYLITQVSLTDATCADIFVDYTDAIVNYQCVLTTDKWHMLIPKISQ